MSDATTISTPTNQVSMNEEDPALKCLHVNLSYINICTEHATVKYCK